MSKFLYCFYGYFLGFDLCWPFNSSVVGPSIARSCYLHFLHLLKREVDKVFLIALE